MRGRTIHCLVSHIHCRSVVDVDIHYLSLDFPSSALFQRQLFPQFLVFCILAHLYNNNSQASSHISIITATLPQPHSRHQTLSIPHLHAQRCANTPSSASPAATKSTRLGTTATPGNARAGPPTRSTSPPGIFSRGVPLARPNWCVPRIWREDS